MAKDQPIQIELGRDSVKQIIDAHVQMAVMEALRPHSEQFVRELVEKALLTKSKSDAYRYKSDDKVPTVLEHMVRTIIAEEARKGIQQWAESHREEIAANIQKAMATKKFGRAMAAQIAQQLAECTKYRFELNVTPIAQA